MDNPFEKREGWKIEDPAALPKDGVMEEMKKKEAKEKEVKETKEAKIERVKTEKEEKEKEEVLKEIQDILVEHGNMESNIPATHIYWGLCNRLRALMNEEKV